MLAKTIIYHNCCCCNFMLKVCEELHPCAQFLGWNSVCNISFPIKMVDDKTVYPLDQICLHLSDWPNGCQSEKWETHIDHNHFTRSTYSRRLPLKAEQHFKRTMCHSHNFLKTFWRILMCWISTRSYLEISLMIPCSFSLTMVTCWTLIHSLKWKVHLIAWMLIIHRSTQLQQVLKHTWTW